MTDHDFGRLLYRLISGNGVRSIRAAISDAAKQGPLPDSMRGYVDAVYGVAGKDLSATERRWRRRVEEDIMATENLRAKGGASE